MADTRRLAMLKAVESTLNGVGKPSGLTIDRFFFRSVERDALPRVVVQHVGQQAISHEVNALTENTDRVRLTVLCEGDQKTAPDDHIDPYFSWVVSALEADLTLGGVVSRIDRHPAGPTDAVESDFVYVRVVQEIDVFYYHNRTDPESAT